MAEKSYVSLATVGRTLKKMGYSGFSEFKITVKNNTEQKQNGFSIEVNDVIHKNEIEITRTINQLSIEEVEKAITIFRQVCVISIFVIGPSISVAKEAQNKFMLFGKTVMIYNDPEAMIYYSKILPRDSLVLCISFNTENPKRFPSLRCFLNSARTVSIPLGIEAAQRSDLLYNRLRLLIGR